jgi:hypothetical protein
MASSARSWLKKEVGLVVGCSCVLKEGSVQALAVVGGPVLEEPRNVLGEGGSWAVVECERPR